MLHGPQQGSFGLDFWVPSECARRIETGAADLGIVPVMEMYRQGLVPVPGTGIACRGAVRSILLVSKVEPNAIRTLAADSGSRTSVMLTRLLLHHRFGAEPRVFEHAPSLDAMLARADAALLIGDSALRLDPGSLPYLVLDLGEIWNEFTGLPMVFALWSGPKERIGRWPMAALQASFAGSLAHGLARMDEIVAVESASRGFAPQLVRDYLTKSIVFEIGAQEQKGLDMFLKLVAAAPPALLPSSEEPIPAEHDRR
jgi:predicted solute-binding protein